MFTRKDRKIRNQKAMIENRDILIKDMEEQAEVQNAELRDLRNENEELNLAVHNYKKATKDLLSKLAQISVIANGFDYRNNNSFETIRQIKELANNFEPIN